VKEHKIVVREMKVHGCLQIFQLLAETTLPTRVDFSEDGNTSSNQGLYRDAPRGGNAQGDIEGTTMMRIAVPLAAAAALICCDISPSHAQYYGDAPWCAVISIGSGGVHWDCEYNTVEACVPNVIAGNRGFCGMNPYYRSGYQAGARQGSPAPHYRHHPQHHTH
jgi:Protein of unknown function (DUF3551)